jgi:hypothetical protein
MNLFQNGAYISQSCLDSYNGDSETQVMWNLDNDSDSFTEVLYINGTKNTAATSDDYLWPPSVNNLALGNYQVQIWLRSIDTNTSFNQTEWFNITVVNNNNTGTMESLDAWTNNENYSSSDDIPLIWSASNLVWNMSNISINYNVTVDVYGYNTATNTTGIVWSFGHSFIPNGPSHVDQFVIPANTLSTGCYFASFNLSDNDDGMFFDNTGFDFDVGMDCSGGSGNNTGNASGAFVNAWPTHGTGNLSDYEMALYWANITVSASNLTNGSQYLLEYEISNDTGSIVDTGSWNWTAMDIEEIHILDVSSLGQGCYNFEVWLSDELGYLEYENWPFTIDMTFADCNNNTGGNGTGNNTDSDGDGYPDWCEQYWGTDPYDPTDFPTQLQDCSNNTGNATDCGTLDNLTDLMVWTDQIMYYEGDTVEGTFVTNCTVLNQTYILGYEIYDVASGIVVLNNSANMWTWTAYYTSDYHTVNWSGLNVSDYAVYGYLMDSSYNTIVDGTYLFSVNAPTTAWGNGTARFIYIKPLAQNADQNTPFNLTFPAPPMADNSPYLSNMICSKAVGHSADVWENYVPMPFNNITSWKVENTYGLVMGMFVMNDAQAAGISSMQNPTVIFEQNLSFSGHAPSTLVDQAYFNCPMVTVSSTLSPVMSPGGSVLSYVVGISVNNSGDWIGDLNWEVATVSNGSSTALMDIGGHLMIESSGALLDHNFSPTGIAADEICLNWELIDENGDELASGSECIGFTPLSEPVCTTVTISNVNTEYVKGNMVIAWFNTELDCHGHSLAYWVNSSTIGTAYSGIIDVDANDPTSWSSTGTNEMSTVELFQTSNGGLIVDNHCITVQVSAYDATGGVISPHIDSDTVCFNVVTTATEECIPWNNAACNTEFVCEDGKDKVAVDAIDNVTGVSIEVWDCQESDGTDDGSSGLLPSIGVFGTLTASMFAVFIIAVRRDEE